MEKLAKLIYAGIIIAICYFAFPIFIPFLLALVVAIIFDPLIIDLQRKAKIKRHISAITVLTLFFGIVFFLIFCSVSTLTKETISIAKQVPAGFQHFVTENEKIQKLYNGLSDETKKYITDSSSTLATKATEIGSKYAGNIFDTVKHFPSYFIGFVIFMVAVYIISIELPRLKPQFLSFFEKGDSRNKVELTLDKLKSAIVGYLKSQVTLGILTFAVSLIGLMIIGTANSFVMAIVIAVVDLIPVIGAGSVLIPWVIYSVATGNISTAIGLIILFTFTSAFRHTVEPKLLGHNIGLSPLLTLMSVYVGFHVLGVVGLILGPIMAIIFISLKEAGMIRFNIKI